MFDIVYATTFKNEQGSTPPKRATIETTGTVLSQVVNSAGYEVSIRLSALSAFWKLSVPTVLPTKRWAIKTVQITPKTTIWTNVVASIFGFEIAANQIAPFFFLEVSVAYTICVVTDLNTNESSVYANGRLVKEFSGSTNSIEFTKAQQVVANHDFGAVFTNLAVVYSDNSSPLTVDFIDQVLVEQANSSWTYNGASFVESINKPNTTATTPRITTFTEGASFTVGVQNTDMPLLVEGAGSVAAISDEGLVLVDGVDGITMIEPLGTTQTGFNSMIVGPGDLTVNRIRLPVAVEIETVPGHKLEVYATGAEDFYISWADGTTSAIFNGMVDITKTYATNLQTKAYIFGNFESLTLTGTALTGLLNWGPEGATYSFYRESTGGTAPNLAKVPNTLPTGTTSLANMFRGSGYNGTDISSWNTANVTDFSGMFRGSVFNQPLPWNTTSAVSMNSMFRDSLFNHAIGDWVVEKIEDLEYMFANNTVFNQNLQWWCFRYVDEEPVGFSDGATAWTEAKPTWGPCLMNCIRIVYASDIVLYATLVEFAVQDADGNNVSIVGAPSSASSVYPGYSVSGGNDGIFGIATANAWTPAGGVPQPGAWWEVTIPPTAVGKVGIAASVAYGRVINSFDILLSSDGGETFTKKLEVRGLTDGWVADELRWFDLDI